MYLYRTFQPDCWDQVLLRYRNERCCVGSKPCGERLEESLYLPALPSLHQYCQWYTDPYSLVTRSTLAVLTSIRVGLGWLFGRKEPPTDNIHLRTVPSSMHNMTDHEGQIPKRETAKWSIKLGHRELLYGGWGTIC